LKRRPAQGFFFGRFLAELKRFNHHQLGLGGTGLRQEELMKTKKEEDPCANATRFELKYCERCGGLWVRPVGGEQVYCVGCARQMAELPPGSREVGRARMQQGPLWGLDHCEYEDGDEGEDATEVWHE
jgi:hypothetical protein